MQPVAPYYYEWLRHPPGEPWWDWAELRNKYDRVQAAVLNLSSWYDEAYGPEGATTNFVGLVTARKGQPDLRTKLVLGPWVHGVDALSETRAGEREFGAEARLDYDKLVLEWLDRYVRGIDNEVDRGKPVRVFVMGANRWREADTWPLLGTQFMPIYLTASAKDGARGQLSWTASELEAQSTEFVSDPVHPVVDPHPPYSGAHDYRTMEQRSDVLLFDSEPLERDLEITGPIAAEIFLSTDAPDTDLWVRRLDVSPDGTAYNLMSPGLDVMRASYRNGGPRRELLTPGRIYRLELRNLVTANL
ncbi:MAG: CocE/NonD family hydrolase, partial [Acidobacteria bacterium]|nr:CocE/NonD family hydrolase [Acidobacteriota bacterium]